MSTKENGVPSNSCSQRPRERVTSLSWWLSLTKENRFDQEARSRLNLSLCQTKPQQLFVKDLSTSQATANKRPPGVKSAKASDERVHVGKQSRVKDVTVKSGVVVSCHESSVSCHDVAVKSGVVSCHELVVSCFLSCIR
ncbi:hypothetical protein F2Q70_00018710 [Brassica cretica]|uniref:Uncharacterized protein n=1 Tax=Brassica cretica TaxID=69181 RepID=A0A8S9KR04_BRACR|nr:hypothetical protein F2Q70_00018710 [Brassica cretica]KAF2597780.1 hypothetical protein F2Q68_00012298 [Brassica cretica]